MDNAQKLKSLRMSAEILQRFIDTRRNSRRQADRKACRTIAGDIRTIEAEIAKIEAANA
jgi:hypothetical protein